MAAAQGAGGMAAPTARKLARKGVATARRRLVRMAKRRQQSVPSLVPRPTDPPSLDVVAALRRGLWTDRGDLRLEGWSYQPGRYHEQSVVRVYATTGGLDSRWEATVHQ